MKLRQFYTHVPTIIAHRGAPLLAIENTLQSFQTAVAQGASVIELDVQRTRDGHLVVFHDSGVDRLTAGSGLIRNFTLRDVQRLLLRGTVVVPLLRDVLQAMPLHVRFVVDVKDIPESVPQIMRVLQHTGTLERSLICSFYPRVLNLVRESSSRIPIAVLTWYMRPSVLHYARTIQAEAVHVYHGWIRASHVRAAHANALRCIVWTPSQLWRMKQLLGMHVDGIITNHVAKAVRADENSKHTYAYGSAGAFSGHSRTDS